MSLLKIAKIILLFLLNVSLFLIFYLLGVYRVDAFRSVLEGISSWPIPSVIKSIFMLGWMSIPIALVSFGVNYKWLKLNLKQFVIIIAIFVISTVITLEFIFKII